MPYDRVYSAPWRRHSCLPRRDSSRRLGCEKCRLRDKLTPNRGVNCSKISSGGVVGRGEDLLPGKCGQIVAKFTSKHQMRTQEELDTSAPRKMPRRRVAGWSFTVTSRLFFSPAVQLRTTVTGADTRSLASEFLVIRKRFPSAVHRRKRGRVSGFIA